MYKGILFWTSREDIEILIDRSILLKMRFLFVVEQCVYLVLVVVNLLILTCLAHSAFTNAFKNENYVE